MWNIVQAGVIGGLAGGLISTLTLWIWHAVPSFPNPSDVDAQIAGSLMGLVIHLLKGLAFTLLLGPWIGSLNRALVLVVGCFYGVGWWLMGTSLLIPFLVSRGRPVMEPGACSATNLLSELLYGLVLGGVSVRILSRTSRVQA